VSRWLSKSERIKSEALVLDFHLQGLTINQILGRTGYTRNRLRTIFFKYKLTPNKDVSQEEVINKVRQFANGIKLREHH
jgi:hypothetical protein